MKRLRPFLTAALACCALLLCTVSASAANSGLSSLDKLTRGEIETLLQPPVLTAPQDYYEEEPSVTAPHTAGVVRQEILDSGLQRVNVVRRLAGLPSVTMSDNYNLRAQKGCVLLAAGNQFTHWPKQPEDMDDAFYDDGYLATTGGNLARFGWPIPHFLSDPISASIDGYMSDSDGHLNDKGENAGNVTAVGHRRWVLYPQMAAVGLGVAHATISPYNRIYSIMYWDTYQNEYQDYDFIAWPASGLFPNTNFIIDEAGNNIYRTPQSDAWSVSLNPRRYLTPQADEITVTLTAPAGDGRVWTFNGDQEYVADNKGLFFTVDGPGCGEGAAIIFRPEGIEQYEGEYTVKITGLKTKAGQDTTLEYSVEFFTPTCLEGHSYTTHTEEATCTTPGQTIGICSKCEAENVLEEIPALGHLWDEGAFKDSDSHTVTCARPNCGESQDLPHCKQIMENGDLTVTTCTGCDLFSSRLTVNALPGGVISPSVHVHDSDDGQFVEVRLNNSADSEVKTTVFLAEYDADGRLLNCATQDITLPGGGSDTKNLPVANTDAHRAILYVLNEDYVPLTARAEYSPAQAGAQAWYEVDDEGKLYINTNIDSSKWDGYTVKARFLFRDGSQSNDFGCGRYYNVNYDCSSMISYFDPGSEVVCTEFLVFKGFSTMEEYWALEEQLGSQEAVLEALGNKLVARFEVEGSVSVTEIEKPIHLTDFVITYDEENQTETYTAKLNIPLPEVGSFGLTFERNSGSGASLSAINPVDGVLTFTREMHHFGNAGDSGTFRITYCVYTMNDDGSITCTKALSSGFDYTFTQ